MKAAVSTSKPAGGLAGFGGDLRARILSALVLVAVAVFGVYLGGIWTGVFAAAFVAIVHVEWASVTEGAALPSAPYTAVVVTATVIASLGMILPALLITLVAILVSGIARRQVWQPSGILYAAALGISLVTLRIAAVDGVRALVFLFAVIAATDTAAFFTGRLVGGPKLWPQVSPNKTWAGTIGGLVGGVVAGLVAASLLGVGVTVALAIVALGLSVAGQAGDLFESFVKRRFGVKDAGHILPGHGGMMDRLDSLTFGSVLAVAIGWAHVGPTELARGLLRW
ncbi:MAG: CDP-archaeol synthase [Bauldia sp.]